MPVGSLPQNTINSASVPNNLKVQDPLQWTPQYSTNTGIGPGTINQNISGNKNNLPGSGYKVFSFPTDLNTPAENGNIRYPYYMIFYVNAQAKSKLMQGKNAPSTAAGTNAVNNSTSSIISQIVSGKTEVNSKAADALKFIGFSPMKKRIDLAIALPMPQALVFQHDAGYETATAGMFGTMMKDFSSGDFSSMGKDVITKMKQEAPNFIANIASLKLGTPQAGSNFDAIKNKLLGIAQNDRKEQAFKGMDSRKFTFSWLLIPRNKNEADQITTIIQWLKFNQYPEIDMTGGSGGLNLIIPNEFDIEFYHNDAEMNHVSRISTCVLEGLTADHTPLGKWIAYDGTDSPVATLLTLKFSEVEPLTRLQVANGY